MVALSGICFFLMLGLYHSTIAQSSQIIRVTSVLDAPLLFQNYVNNDSYLSGFVPDLLEALSDETGLKFELQLSKDGLYGAPLENGTWVGMIGELMNNETDVGLLVTQTANRYAVVDFTNVVMAVEPVIVQARPEVVYSWRERLFRLIKLMEFSVWLIIVLAFLVTSTVLFIVASVNPFEWRAMGKRGEASIREVETFTCIQTFWFILSTMFWQGYVRAPRSIGGRLIVTGWFFFVMIVILAYTASLINFLQIGPEPSVALGFSQIKSFRDLAQNEDTVVGMLSSGSTYGLFKNAPNDSVEGKIFEKAQDFMAKNGIRSTKQGIKLITDRPVRDKSFAYIMESGTARYVASQNCDLLIVTDMIAHRFLSMAVQKQSPLLHTLNQGLTRLQERGVVLSIEHKWFRTSPCSLPQTSTNKDILSIPAFYALDMQTISGAILVLVVGIVLGCLMTVVEVCLYRKSQGVYDSPEENLNVRNNVPEATGDKNHDEHTLIYTHDEHTRNPTQREDKHSDDTQREETLMDKSCEDTVNGCRNEDLLIPSYDKDISSQRPVANTFIGSSTQV